MSCIASQIYKERIKELVKKYSDKHKDLHGSISKIGKVIDKVIKILFFLKSFLIKSILELYLWFWKFTTVRSNWHKREKEFIKRSYLWAFFTSWQYRHCRFISGRRPFIFKWWEKTTIYWNEFYSRKITFSRRTTSFRV